MILPEIRKNQPNSNLPQVSVDSVFLYACMQVCLCVCVHFLAWGHPPTMYFLWSLGPCGSGLQDGGLCGHRFYSLSFPLMAVAWSVHLPLYTSKKSLRHGTFHSIHSFIHSCTHQIVPGNLQYASTVPGPEVAAMNHLVPAPSLPTGSLHSSGVGERKTMFGRQCQQINKTITSSCSVCTEESNQGSEMQNNSGH